MVNTREDAQQAVDATKYPPVGARSIGGALAPYGFGTMDRQQYVQAANDEIMVIIQIESASALQNLDSILSVPGIDCAFVGPNDLHAQLGFPPSTEGAEPEFVEALERVKAGAREHQVATGIMTSGGEATVMRIQQGFQLICVTSDLNSMVAAATQNLRRARDESSN
jgi:4-hydroxy-2-oxoheptanedioate aldolase